MADLEKVPKVKNYSDYQNDKSSASLLISRIFSYIFLVFVTFISLFSFVMLVINSTHTGAELQGDFTLIPGGSFIKNFRDAMTLYPLPSGMLNSFIVAACTAILSVYFSAMTAYGLYVYDFRGRKFAHKFIIMVMMIPTQVSVAGFIQIVRSLDLVNTYWPLIIPAIASPATYFYMKQYLEGALPLEVVEAARVDGSNEFRTFNMISIPMIKPALAVQLIFAFVGSWNNFFTPQLVLTDKAVQTVPIMLAQLKSEILSNPMIDLGTVYMVMFVAIIPVVIVYIFLSKFIIKGVTLGSVKG